MSVRRIDQTMAKAAAELLPDTVDGKLRTRYRTLSVMSRDAGLAATYAYVAAKGKGRGDLPDAYRKVATGIRDHLENRGLKPATVRSERDILRHLGEMDLHTYARASAEVAALLRWLSRLADAVHQTDDAAPPKGPDDAATSEDDAS
ncbi:type III-B CRISPR module-associated protein Cmr5 [Actinocorallia sp. API 0066]|uniref:type III-B CRISPR module-associated protein Cmr5 n=1 Tax=Actinocorallia sp. API 0066 TaxID=2896846 RepID=UPI001E42B37C|nr:type III-B CRISPR module-associated protein Cmr5 [Actinocorallia sp. API 0066]MCD0448604.1 type III-B CRISPR module-associated protein Cmr5 [Actinocorallia sp. API 0066]